MAAKELQGSDATEAANKFAEMAGKEDLTEAGLTELHIKESAPQHEFSIPWNCSDAVLVVEGQNLHVHRVILGMVSPVFQKMFSQQVEEGYGNEISLPDKKANEFVDFLRQIYPQFSNTLTFGNVEYIYALAEEFQVANLLTACKAFVSSQQLTTRNALKILTMAQQWKLDEVRQKCCKELQKFTLQHLEGFLSFEDLNAESLREILVPKAKRLEKCLQEVVPQLLGFVDCAVYLASTSDKYLRKPKLCPLHYDVNSKKPNRCLSSDERLRCKVCLLMLADLDTWQGIYPGQSYIPSNRCYTSGQFRFDQKVQQIFPEISALVHSQK